MKLNLIEEISRIKTLISELKGEGATPPGGAAGAGTTGAGTKGAGTVKVYKIPSELKNVEDFQKWVVSKGFGSELGPRGVDNRYGRYTAAAFAKHKGDYLKKPLADDEYTNVVDAVPNDTLTDTNTDPNNVNQTNVNPQQNADSDTEDLLKK